jgi:formylglycine-generating enzyme required for sulfatase activity
MDRDEVSRSLATSLDSGSVGPKFSAKFVKIPAGTFQMGSPSSEPNRYDNEALHSVTISHGFEMQVTDVTQLQWFLVMGNNPSYFKSQKCCESDYVSKNGTDLCPNNPVDQVSWDDVQAFVAKVNQGNDGYTYRLPTEAEWEYAARAGTQTAYYFGDHGTQLDAYGWYSNNSGSQTHPVGGKTPNAFGLYDMAGNVWQWTQDYFGNYGNSPATDPTGPSSGPLRVFRGGDWARVALFSRSAFRLFAGAGARFSILGFRLVRTQLETPTGENWRRTSSTSFWQMPVSPATLPWAPPPRSFSIQFSTPT